jgi:UDP-N-acetylglucosamine 2-epimerase (non-hydrolysing)
MPSDRSDIQTGARLLDFRRPASLDQTDPLEAGLAEGPDTIIHVAATRWDFVKLAPIVTALDRRGAFRQVIVHAGVSSYIPDELGLPTADHALGIADGSHALRTAAILAAFERVLLEECPVAVVVIGDTDAALAGALGAAKLSIPVAHVESGLRSGDWSVPEEVNRVITDRLSDVLFAHSPEGLENLVADGIGEQQVHQVGSTLIDSLRRHERQARTRAAWLSVGVHHSEYVLVSLERPDNLARSDRLAEIAAALVQLAEHGPVVFPVDARTRGLLGSLLPALEEAGVHCIEPMGYLDTLSLASGAGAIVTDSGEVQEEAAALGVCCFTFRAFTERPVTVARGTNVLLGSEPATIAAVRASPFPPTPCVIPLWDGSAGKRIAEVLVSQYALLSAPAVEAR